MNIPSPPLVSQISQRGLSRNIAKENRLVCYRIPYYFGDFGVNQTLGQTKSIGQDAARNFPLENNFGLSCRPDAFGTSDVKVLRTSLCAVSMNFNPLKRSCSLRAQGKYPEILPSICSGLLLQNAPLNGLINGALRQIISKAKVKLWVVWTLQPGPHHSTLMYIVTFPSPLSVWCMRFH